jgi:flagellar basal-body rod protein FlgB
LSAAGLPLIEMLKTRMHFHQARQKVLAQNVANSDTPGFKPQEIREPTFDRGGRAVGGSLGVARTNAAHIASTTGRPGIEEKNARRFETRPSGNSVNLEDEMLKVAQNQSDYQLAASLYQKSMQMLKTAIGRR